MRIRKRPAERERSGSRSFITVRFLLVSIVLALGVRAAVLLPQHAEAAEKNVIDEIEYTEYGMSERLLIHVRSDRTLLRRPDHRPGGKEVEKERPTMPSHWQKLCHAVETIGTAVLVDVEPPSNGRAADSALYARISVKIDGEWYRSKYFDDSRPPEALKHLHELLLANRYKSTKGPE